MPLLVPLAPSLQFCSKTLRAKLFLAPGLPPDGPHLPRKVPARGAAYSYDKLRLIEIWRFPLLQMSTSFRRVTPGLLQRLIKRFREESWVALDQLAERCLLVPYRIPRNAFERCHSVLNCTGDIRLGAARKITQRLVKLLSSRILPSLIKRTRCAVDRLLERLGAPDLDPAIGELPADSTLAEVLIDLLGEIRSCVDHLLAAH